MRVEIWSDIACPWCYIGRRRFETALRQFDHADEIEVVWRSFELDPNAPREYPGTVADMLVERKGLPKEQVIAMNQQVTSLGAQEGLTFNFDQVRVGNSFDAHRLIHFAAERGLQSEMKERLQKACFTDGLPYGTAETLVALAGEVGLDTAEVAQMLASDDYAADVRADEQRAQSIGVSGVPFFLFDEKYAVSGAQPATLFQQALNQAWGEHQPKIKMMSSDANVGVCDDDGCAI